MKSMQTTSQAPRCPNCCKAMNLVRVVPHLGGLPDLYSYECKACRVVIMEAAEPDVYSRPHDIT